MITLLNKYNCNWKQSAAKSEMGTRNGKPKCGEMEFRLSSLLPNYIYNYHNEITSVELRLDRTSVLNNYIVSRSNRQYSALEAFGIFLGGFGLFLGVDILCLIESVIEYIKSKKESRRRRLQESIAPIAKHWMRVFHNFQDEPGGEQDENEDNAVHNFQDEPGEEQDENEENAVHRFQEEPEDKKDQENETTKHAQIEEKDTASSKANAAFVLSAVIIFFCGICITIYAGTSNLLTATEYNLEIKNETISQSLPLFAICKDVIGETKLDQKEINGTLEDTRCFLGMVETPCLQVFNVYLYTGKYHCWVTGDQQKKITKKLTMRDDYAFIFATYSVYSFNKVFSSMWAGDVTAVLDGVVMPFASGGYDLSILEQLLLYQEYRYATSEHRFFTGACKHCSAVQSNTSCCIVGIGQSDRKPGEIFNANGPQHHNKTYKVLQTRKLAEYERNDIQQRLHMDSDYEFVAFRRSMPYVFVFAEKPRHSPGAKFALISGFVDLFLGLSVLSFVGAALLWIWRKIVLALLWIWRKLFQN